MFVLALHVEVFLQQAISGDDLCSRSSRDIYCVPSSEICPVIQVPCNTTYYYCPKQCGKSIPASRCHDVCDENCLCGRCEYTHGRRLGLTCIGCKSEFTGQMCLEYCPVNCKECDQFDATCNTCNGNYGPPDCSEIVSTKATGNTITPTTTSCYNCSVKCRVCHTHSGDCDECSHGYYGRKCEKLCTHCNISQCAMDRNCLQCISNLSSSGCVTAWTDYKTTTTSLVKSTDVNCRQIPERKTVRWLKEDTLTLICVLLAAVILLYGMIRSLKMLTIRFQPKSLDLDYRASSPNENRPGQPRCPDNSAIRVSNHYESIGSQAAQQDADSVSFLSSISGIMFQNPYELSAACLDREESYSGERQLCNPDYVTVDEYEMLTFSYLTPSLPASATCSDTV